MTDIVVNGEIESALTHFTGLGLATIGEAAGFVGIRLSWSDEDKPRLSVSFPHESADSIATSLHAHAVSMADPESWVQQTMNHEKRQSTGVFSPRIKVPTSGDSWANLTRLRRRSLDALLKRNDRLSLSMIGALGEPSYWRFERQSPRPDAGASRWEMKTRNRGAEFIGDRFAPLARTVALRAPEDVLAGVTGERTDDELDGSPDSRTATGLQRPGPADSAQAWVALWGLTAFPVAHDPHAQSQTAGAFPQDRLHTRWFVVPIFDRPVSLSRWRSVIASEPLAVLGRQIADDDHVGAYDRAAESQLVELGSVALGAARVDLRGSSSAPERVILDVEVTPLGEEYRHG